MLQARMDQSTEGRLEWCTYKDQKDFPDKFVALPWMIPYVRDRQHESGMLGEALVADTLDELRAQMPDWLVHYVPEIIIDPTVVEVWHRVIAAPS